MNEFCITSLEVMCPLKYTGLHGKTCSVWIRGMIRTLLVSLTCYQVLTQSILLNSVTLVLVCWFSLSPIHDHTCYNISLIKAYSCPYVLIIFITQITPIVFCILRNTNPTFNFFGKITNFQQNKKKTETYIRLTIII